MEVITIANQKGGTAKSSTAVILAQAAAADGKRTLAIDFDPQGNFSFSLAADMRRGSSFDLLETKRPAQLIQRSSTGPDIIPASRDLSTITSSRGSARRLQTALRPLQMLYDVIIIDTPTAAGELQYNGLQAATKLLIPLHAELYSLQALHEMAAIAPQIMQSNPALKEIGVVITQYDGRSNIAKQMHENIIEAARDLNIAYYGTIRAGAPVQEAVSIRRAELPAATAKKADIVEYPMDKPNSKIWSLLQETTGRQLKLAINTAKNGSDKRLNVYYSIDFDELEKNGIKVTKKLLPFDKRVYIAVAALYNAGNNYITLTQIFYAMGNTGKPSKNQLEKISESVTKMQGANIFIDNIQESEAYNYLRFHYKGYLLPIEITTATINGQLAESAIRILREPPMMTFAKQRKQITTITVKVLQSPISKTDANLLIDDYLIERIGRAKRGGQSCKILYDTLYENTQIITTKQRQRAPEKIKTYLEHYKSCGLIEDFQMLNDGIKIEFAPGP